MRDALDVFSDNMEESYSNELIPEGKQEFYVAEVNVSKPIKSKRAKSLRDMFFKVIEVNLYNKEYDKFLKFKFYLSKTNKKNYKKFVEVTGCEKVVLNEGKYTYVPENKCTESPAGAVGSKIYAYVTHSLRPKRTPLRDENGNNILDENGKWIWKDEVNEHGEPIMTKYEEIMKTDDGTFAIEKYDKDYEPFFPLELPEEEEEEFGGVEDFFV